MDISNYEITKNKMQATFAAYDHSKIAEKLHLRMDQHYLYLTLFDRPFRVNRQNGCMEWSKDGFATCIEGDFNEVMTILDLLCYSAEGAKPAYNYTVLHSLSAVQTADTYAGKGFFDRETQAFDSHLQELDQACCKLGGIPFGKGDVCRKIAVFQDLSVIFQFWASDDEFPASMKIFCDKNTLSFMHYETVWYMASELVKLIEENLGE